MIGAPGCRNEKFLNKQVSVAEEVIPMSQILNWFPVFLRPYASLLSGLDAAYAKFI
jgi:hypothetical protein